MVLKIGVLAVQGDVEEHIWALKNACKEYEIDCEIIQVKLPKHLEGLHGITIPGGESTTIGILTRKFGVLDKLKQMIENGFPVFGTCAGMIMLAKEVKDAVVGITEQPILSVMNISVIRNVFGRQKDSFEIDLDVQELGKTIRAVFIRAPAIEKYWGKVKPLAKIKHDKYGELIVFAREENMLASSFHPELTKDTTVFKYFINMILEYKK